MKRENEIQGFVQLGKLMTALGNKETWSGFSIGSTEIEYQKLQEIINKQFVLNGWFSKENVLQSLQEVSVKTDKASIELQKELIKAKAFKPARSQR